MEFVLHDAPPLLPVIAFNNAKRKPMTLDAFRGKTVLLHLWATSAPGSAQQLQSLDRLQRIIGGNQERFEVVALSVDAGGEVQAAIRDWYMRAGVRQLQIYHDPTASAGTRVSAARLPITLMVDARGRERGRTTAVVEWDSPTALALIRTHLAAEP